MSTRVLIVEDSAAVRLLLEHVVGGDPRFTVVASVESAEEAIQRLPKLRPDVISMDVSLPGMSGLEATRIIMHECPTPTVVVSANAGPGEVKLTMDALHAGALAAVEKPAGPSDPRHRKLVTQLLSQLELMSRVRVIRQRRFRASTKVPTTPPACAVHRDGYEVVGIVASTGGPRAVEQVLRGLPASFSLPILLVQHIGDGFLGGFVAWLHGLGLRKVCQARAGECPAPGVVHVAPAGRHLKLSGGRFRDGGVDPVAFHCPSGSVLLESVASEYGKRAIGVVLTGMGDDGARGLASIHRAGGYALVEDETTAVVSSMPRHARERTGAESLPIQEIGARLGALDAARSRA